MLHQTDYDTTLNGLICGAWSYTSESVLFDPRRPRLSRQGFRPGSPLRDLLNGYGLPLNLDSVDEIGMDMIGPTFRLIDLCNFRRKPIIPSVTFTLDLREEHDVREPWYRLVTSSTSDETRHESWEELEPSLQRAILDAPVGAVKNTQAETSDSEDDSEDSWTTASESEEDCGSDGDEDDSGSDIDGSVEDGT